MRLRARIPLKVEGTKTVEMVEGVRGSWFTLLKQGVNEIGAGRSGRQGAKWATKTGYVICHAAPLKKVPPASHMRHLRDNGGAVPPRVEVFGQQAVLTTKFCQIQRNQWPCITESQAEYPPPPADSYKVAFHFRRLMLLVAHWSDPDWTPIMSAGIHIPLWPTNKLHITYHNQLPPLDMNDPKAPLDRFSSTLGACDMDALIKPYPP